MEEGAGVGQVKYMPQFTACVFQRIYIQKDNLKLLHISFLVFGSP